MEILLKSKITELFTKYNFSKDDASFLSNVLREIDDKQDKKFEVSKELFLSQKDKTDLTEKVTSMHKALHIVGLFQFLAIIGAVLAIINFMLK